jgi:response regulator RpfG family c-di-GMP phosphodiesterase
MKDQIKKLQQQKSQILMNNKLILIVEDEEDILELLEYTLQKEGYETIGFLNIDKNVRNVLNEEQIDLDNLKKQYLFYYNNFTGYSHAHRKKTNNC